MNSKHMEPQEIPLAELCVKIDPQCMRWKGEQCSIEVFDWIESFAGKGFSAGWVRQQTMEIVMETSQMMLKIAKVLKRCCKSNNEKDIELKVKYQLGRNNKCSLVFDEAAFNDTGAEISLSDARIVEAMFLLLNETAKHTLLDLDAFLEFITGSADGADEYAGFAEEMFGEPLLGFEYKGELQ